MKMMNDDGVGEWFGILIMDAHWAVGHFPTSTALWRVKRPTVYLGSSIDTLDMTASQ